VASRSFERPAPVGARTWPTRDICRANRRSHHNVTTSHDRIRPERAGAAAPDLRSGWPGVVEAGCSGVDASNHAGARSQHRLAAEGFPAPSLTANQARSRRPLAAPWVDDVNSPLRRLAPTTIPRRPPSMTPRRPGFDGDIPPGSPSCRSDGEGMAPTRQVDATEASIVRVDRFRPRRVRLAMTRCAQALPRPNAKGSATGVSPQNRQRWSRRPP
jgi:hypothetical protein